MSFPPKVAEKVLVDCRRSCAICHKFCGFKLELHHIKPKALGGADSYDNCIPLCFDCHAEVRAYDVKHPKGKKYTESELIQHRRRWYAKVNEPTNLGETEAIEQHPNISDPSTREGVRQFYLRIYGKAPTTKEVDDFINNSIYVSGTDHISVEEFEAEFGQENIQVTKRQELIDSRFTSVFEDYKKRGTPKYMIDSFPDLTNQEKADLYERAVMLKKGRKSKNNPYL